METLKINETFEEPKKYRLCVDLRTMQARREERAQANAREQIILYNTTTQLLLTPRGSDDWDCIKLALPSDNRTEPFSYVVVDKDAVLVDKNATLPPVGPSNAARPTVTANLDSSIQLWALNRSYSGGVVRLINWYLEQSDIPVNVPGEIGQQGGNLDGRASLISGDAAGKGGSALPRSAASFSGKLRGGGKDKCIWISRAGAPAICSSGNHNTAVRRNNWFSPIRENFNDTTKHL